MYTLNATGVHGVAIDVYNHKIDGQITATLTEACGGTNTSGPKILTNPVAVDMYNMSINEQTSQTLSSSASDINHTGGTITNARVRRLTPVECERLQGFPDNFTNIPYRKKEESPDGPRYKALGNSMAVPVMAWIGKRIQEVTDIINEQKNVENK